MLWSFIGKIQLMSLPFLAFALFFSFLSFFLLCKLCSHIFEFEGEKERQALFFFFRREKNKAFWQAFRLGFYQAESKSFLKSKYSYITFYLCLHFLFPLWGFAFFLQSDGNFLVVLASIFISLQVHHRIFSQTP